MKDQTNERFQGLFKGNFELVNYIIDLGEYRIMSGHETSLDAILNEALRHPNPSYLEDLKSADQADKDE